MDNYFIRSTAFELKHWNSKHRNKQGIKMTSESLLVHAHWVNCFYAFQKVCQSIFTPLLIWQFILTVSHLTEDFPVFTSYNGQWPWLTHNDMKSLTNYIFIRTSCLLDNCSEHCGGSTFHGNIFAPWHVTLTLCQMAAGVMPCLCYTTVRPLQRFTVKPEFTRKQNSGPSFSLRVNSFNFSVCPPVSSACMNRQLP